MRLRPEIALGVAIGAIALLLSLFAGAPAAKFDLGVSDAVFRTRNLGGEATHGRSRVYQRAILQPPLERRFPPDNNFKLELLEARADVMSGALRRVGVEHCGAEMCVVYTQTNEYTHARSPYRGYWSIPIKPTGNREVRRVVMDRRAVIRSEVVVYNGQTVQTLDVLCYDPGPMPCKLRG